ncbi:MAG: MFS transporter [Thermoplasmata archaeon]
MRLEGSLLSNSKFARLWTAGIVSRFGSALGYVVLIWYVYAETGSAIAIVYVGLAEFLPTVALGLFSGAVVDRYERRSVVFLSVLGRAAAMGALVLSLYILGFSLDIIVAASAVFAVCATFFGPGSDALLPEIVPRESLDTANGLSESTESVAGIVGGAAGGVLVLVVGAVPSLGVDAASYLVAGILVALIGTTAISKELKPRSESFVGEVREGLVFLRRSEGLFQMTVVSLVMNFLFSIVLTFLVVYTVELLRTGPVVYGVLEALLAAGWGVGGLMVGRLRLTRFTGRLVALTGLVEGAGVLGLTLVPSVPVALPLIFVVAIWQGVLNVAALSTVQAVVPQEIQGRYLATDNALSYAAIPASQIFGGILIATSGLPFTFLLVGIGSVVAGIAFLFLRSLRTFGYSPRAQNEPV